MKNGSKNFLYRCKKSLPGRVAAKIFSSGRKFIGEKFAETALKFFNFQLSRPNFFYKRILGKNFNIIDQESLLVYFRGKNRPRFTPLFEDKSRLNALIEGKFPRLREEILSRADFILVGRLDLPVVGEISTGGKIDWHRDYLSGYLWNRESFFKNVRVPFGEAEMKAPWEVSRFHYLVSLGQAYSLTGDEKYTLKFIDLVEDWILNNPFQMGVNWFCAMEAAIRSVNWAVALEYFIYSPHITGEFLEKILKSLYCHGCYIMENLENRGVVGNHFLSDLAGLIFLGTLFPESSESEKWRNYALENLIKEMERQIYGDGCNFESSTCYQRFALEVFFYSVLLVTKNHPFFTGENFIKTAEKIFPEKFLKKLRGMFDSLLYLSKPDGRISQIGDNDGSRFFDFYHDDILKVKYLLDLGAVFFADDIFRQEKSPPAPEILWILGTEGVDSFEKMKGNDFLSLESKAFRDGGWFVSRSGKNYCLISCGPNGQEGIGGHGHNDKLSFELFTENRNRIVDPGSYLYLLDPHLRDIFRGTACHNTVSIDGEEQNRLPAGNPFLMKDDAAARFISWQEGENWDVFVGEHGGYERLENPVLHRRQIKFFKKEGRLEILDIFTGEGSHKFCWNFILSPECYGAVPKVSGEILEGSGGILAWEIVPACYSPEYGKKVETQKLTAQIESSVPLKVRIEITAGEKSP